MTDRNDDHERIAALGQPPESPDPDADPDFAREYQETAVDDEIITGEDADEREPESPRGWSGMQR